MADQGSGFARFDIRTDDPERAHELLRESYVDFAVRFSGDADAFEYRHTGAAGPSFSSSRLRYAMAGELDSQVSRDAVFVNLCPSGRVAVTAAGRTVVAGPSEPVLMPPDVPGWQVAMHDMTVDSLVLERVAPCGPMTDDR